MNIIDVAVLLLVGVSVLLGFWRGFVAEFFSLFAWAAAVIAGWVWGEALGAAVASHLFADARLQWLIGAVLLAFGVFMVSNLLRGLFQEALKRVGMSNFDRFLGACFGVLRGVALVWLGAKVLLWLGAAEASWWQEARFRPLLEESIVQVLAQMPGRVGVEKKGAS